jgi:hypothetical protein
MSHKAPLARIERLGRDLPDADEVDAVVLTSANAAFALGILIATCRSSRWARPRPGGGCRGRQSVTTAEGEWQSLARLLAGPDGPPPGARLLHLSGAEIRGDLAGAARAAGFVDRAARRLCGPAEPWLDRRVLDLLQQAPSMPCCSSRRRMRQSGAGRSSGRLSRIGSSRSWRWPRAMRWPSRCGAALAGAPGCRCTRGRTADRPP